MSRIKEFPLPDLGEGLLEGEILSWLVKVGDTITQNQPIVEVETAKAAVEIPAKWAGKVAAIYHQEGTTIEVGTPIIAIDTDPGAGDLPELPTGPATPAEGDEAANGGRTPVLVGYGPRSGAATRRVRKGAAVATPAPVAASHAAVAAAFAEPVSPAAPPPPAAVATPTAPPVAAASTVRGSTSGVALAKPPVRKLAKDLGVDLHLLTGSGPQGSITRDDVQAALAAPAPAAVTWADREQRIPIKGVRRHTAANMVASAFTAPHATVFLTVDVTRTMRTIARMKRLPDWADVRVSPLLLVAKAALVGIAKYPMMNSTWSAETNEIIVKEYVNLGIAAATERGLMVPNIKDAGRLRLRELAEAMNALVGVARDGRTSPADLTGGTFSITNVGVFGVDTGTPILPPGEAAILAFGVVRETPWVHKGKIKVRQVTTLSLSFDHRIIDGELGSKFLGDVARFLHDPGTTLLGSV